MEIDYKSILIKNNTKDASVTLYVYKWWDRLCFMSLESKIIPAGTRHLYRNESFYKFKIKAESKDSKREILSPTLWNGESKITIQPYHVEIKDLEDQDQEKRICIRNINKDEEIKHGAGRNLYELLKLNMNEVRELKTEEEKAEKLKKHFLERFVDGILIITREKVIRTWHARY